MARRRFRIFIVRRRLAEGCVFQNTKEAKAMFEDIKRVPFFGLRNAVPEKPVLLMNTYPSYQMAEALIMPDLFAPSVCVGIARRLPNGRGYRVVACVPNNRLLPNKNGHVYSFPQVRKWLDTFLTMEKISRNGVYGKGVPDRLYSNEWTDPAMFTSKVEPVLKVPNEVASIKAHIQDRDIESLYKDLITAPVIGVDPGSPNGDVSVAARGFVTDKGIDIVSFDIVANPFPEAVCKEKKP